MIPPAFIGTQPLIDYLGLNVDRPAYSLATLGSNIRTASYNLEKWSGCFFADRHQSLSISTMGRSIIPIPRLRTFTAATWNNAVLTIGANPNAWLLPDIGQTGVSTSIQLRVSGGLAGRAYLANQDWFDRGLDSPYWPGNYGGLGGSLPNDLILEGDWGYPDDGLPEPLMHATKILAGWYTLRPDSILANVKIDTSGNVLAYGELPPEVGAFVAEWRVGTMAVAVG